MTFSEIKRMLVNTFQRQINNIVSLGNDSTLESDFKPLKVGGKNTPIEISETEVKVNGSPIITEAGDVDSLDDLSDVTYSGGDLTINSLDKIVADDFVVDSGASVELDSDNGNFISKKAGTEFSAANSAYAGMILGYTDIGLDEPTATYNTTTSFVVPTSEFKVAFTAPPSGQVEISMQVMYDVGSSNVADLFAGLSDNATYHLAAGEDIHQVEIYDAMSRGAIRTIKHSWTVTGLTAGTAYERWVGFKTSNTTGTPHLQWGGDAVDLFPDFIMKATALPATIAT